MKKIVFILNFLTTAYCLSILHAAFAQEDKTITAFLLKKLQETSGNVTYAELSDYVTKQVKRQSVVINDKRQTPTVIPSAALVNKWENLKLKQ
jgi:hypothetical protein